MLRTTTRTLFYASNKWVSRFRVPPAKRLESALILQQTQVTPPQQPKITDVYLNLEGVVTHPYPIADRLFVPKDLHMTLQKLRKWGYRVGVYSTQNRSKITPTLWELSKLGIEFDARDTATACEVDPQCDLELGLLKRLKEKKGKPLHAANILAVFDHKPDASIRLGCWGAGLPSHALDKANDESNPQQLKYSQNENYKKLYDQGPNFVIPKISDLLELVDDTNQLMKQGEMPLSCLNEKTSVKRFSPT